MMESGNSVPGRGDQAASDTDIVRNYQASINESTFSELSARYDEAQRDEEFLSQALECARVRRRVLEAAMGVLNEPQQAVPSPVR